ncbi:MAG: NAD(P)-binding domain-containing protein [Chloroflexota bacterium]
MCALLAHARSSPAAERGRLAALLAARQPAGSVLLVTCHRVELYGSPATLAPVAIESRRAGAEKRSGEAVARHLMRVAVGLESAVVAEDQVLHQLRQAVHKSRAASELPADLNRMFDLALRAGRRARSWMPARRTNLAEKALIRVIGRKATPAAPVLVVGTGEMGRLAAASLRGRGSLVLIASRTPERARAMAERMSASCVPFDPGPSVISGLAGVVVALAGPWPVSDQTRASLIDSAAWVVDLSAPPALHDEIAQALGARLVALDDLTGADVGARVATGDSGLSVALIERLEALVDGTLTELERWAASDAQRAAADALSRRASAVGVAELDRLWQRVPSLDDVQREEVERMVRQLTQRLLRDPLERLSQDGDGRHARAARELFRL